MATLVERAKTQNLELADLSWDGQDQLLIFHMNLCKSAKLPEPSLLHL